MKILKHIITTLVWTALGLYLAFLLLTWLPAGQEYLGRKASQLLSRQLGTSVRIHRVSLGLVNHLTLYNVDIRDQQRFPMLWANRLSARIELLPLAEGKVSVATAQIFGLNGRFYQRDSVTAPNYQFLIDSLASKDTTSHTPLNLRVNSLIIRHSRVKFDRLDMPATPRRFNPGHMNFSNISAHLVLKELTDDSLHLNVKRLSFREQSGLRLERLSMRFEGGRHGLLLRDFMLRLPHTQLTLGDITATYRFRGDHFVTPSLRYSGTIEPSHITLSELACFLPSLKNFNSVVSLRSAFSGRGEDLQIHNLLVGSTTGDIQLDARLSVSRMTQAAPNWHADISDLNLSAKTLNFISQNIKGERAEVPAVLVRLGDIHMKGIVSGSGLNALQTRSLLNTSAGNVALHFDMDAQRHFRANIDTRGISLRQLTGDERFGQLATNIELSGLLPRQGTPSVTAKGIVSHFQYNGYEYSNIDINGSYSSRDINGRLSISDPNLGFAVEGHITRSGQASDVKLTATLQDLSPRNIKMSDRWGDARFWGELTANIRGTDLRDAVGTIDISRFRMESPQTHYELERLHVESGYHDDTHYLLMDSDFGQAEITGDFDYHTLAQSFTNFVAAKLPTLPGLPPVNPHTRNDFAFNVSLTKSDWMGHLLQVPLTLSQPLTLQGMVNDSQREINLECDLPRFSYQGNGYRGGRVSITSPHDSLRFDVSITKLVESGNHLRLSASGSAHNNQLATTLHWDNHAPARMKGTLNASANFDTPPGGQPTAYVRLMPSVLTINNADWDVKPSHVTYSKQNVQVSGFSISHGQQHLRVNGMATASSHDSLLIDLSGIDIEYVLALVDFDAVSFSGLATGTGVLRGLFGDFQADAHLLVDNFKFEGGRMGTLQAQVDWNTAQEQIDIRAVSDDGPDAMTYIEGYVTPARDSINLGIRAEGTHLDFARSFTSSFLNHVEGHAQGELRLAGPLDAINLTGHLLLNGHVHVTATNCDYELRNDSLLLVPNEIEFRNCPIYDIHGRTGILTGGIHHQDLTNLTYDIYATAENLLAYDFRDFGDDTFYGTVFANGRVGIHGRDNGVTIDADVTPQAGTVFVYNAASPDAINNQEFIEWTSQADTTSQHNGHGGADGNGHGSADGGADGNGHGNGHGGADGGPEESSPTAATADEDDDFRSDLHMNFHVNATPQSTVRLLMDARTNDYITLHGNGDLHATFYNKGTFDLFGTYRVADGTYGVTIQNIIRKNFTFQEGGTIVFGGDPYDANLQLQAQHVVNGVSLSDLNVGNTFNNTVRVNCLMNITGQPRQPVVDFDLDLLNVNSDEKQMVRSIINSEDEMNQQVIYLLAVGRFYPQQANNAEVGNTGASKTSLAMQSLLSGTLSGQLNNMLNHVIKNDNWNFGANISTGDEGWNNAEYEGLVSGRMLNNRLLINGQFGYRDNATTATPSFIGDFDIRYLLLPNGNLALKVYNQTNDRYFTRSSLNTQGIGIIMKKDFNGLSDLFGHRQRKKKTNGSQP